eukprot:CAMPEP_0174752814 /NCGR_PEP_ID=MMETSP1094-20130205/102816_1 /TAXON_ID=156173 /ORGANISM="Chrysochromulina brevifilum, Strain UTEX LB 985" /LENGTH=40 /DNA_ID= /DNA_START= /DNA_END= /DNA_ORIENTATION=
MYTSTSDGDSVSSTRLAAAVLAGERCSPAPSAMASPLASA